MRELSRLLPRILRSVSPALVGAVVLSLTATPMLEPTDWERDPASGALSAADATFQREGYDVRVSVIDPARATGFADDRTLLVVADPSSAVLPPTATALSEWSSEGGGLWIADGEGGAANLVEEVGVPVTSRRILEADVAGDPTEVSADLQNEGQTYRVTLRQPFAIDEGSLDEQRWTPAAWTLDRSFADLNGNGELDEGDPRGPFVVGVADEDRTVATTSGHLFTDDGLAQDEGTEALTSQARTLLPSDGTIVMDASHAEHGVVGGALLALLRPAVAVTSAPVWGALATLAVAAAAGLWLLQRSEMLEAWSVERTQPSDVLGDDPAEDLAFMARVLDSANAEAQPDFPRELRERVASVEIGTNRSRER